MRIALAGGELTVTRPDGSVQVLCRAEEVRRMVRVEGPGPSGRVFVVTVTTAWMLPEAGWAPGGRAGQSGPKPRQRSAATGAAALARALGVQLQYAGPNASKTPAGPGVRVVTLDPRPRPAAWVPVLRVICLAAWVIGFTVLVADAVGTHRLTATAILTIGWTLLLTPALWLAGSGLATVLRSWQPRQARVPPVPPEGAVLLRPEPAGPATRPFRQQCWLLVGERELAVRSAFGLEAWLPGPACGGVRQGLLVGRPGTPEYQLHLARDDGSVLLVLPLDDWAGSPAGRDRLLGALTACGVRIAEPAHAAPGLPDAGLQAFPTQQDLRRDRPRYVEDLDVFLPLFLCVGAQAYAVRGGVTPSSVIGALPLVGFAVASLRRRLLDRPPRSWPPKPPSPPAPDRPVPSKEGR
jgi:hypothetical protein